MDSDSANFSYSNTLSIKHADSIGVSVPTNLKSSQFIDGNRASTFESVNNYKLAAEELEALHQRDFFIDPSFGRCFKLQDVSATATTGNRPTLPILTSCQTALNRPSLLILASCWTRLMRWLYRGVRPVQCDHVPRIRPASISCWTHLTSWLSIHRGARLVQCQQVSTNTAEATKPTEDDSNSLQEYDMVGGKSSHLNSPHSGKSLGEVSTINFVTRPCMFLKWQVKDFPNYTRITPQKGIPFQYDQEKKLYTCSISLKNISTKSIAFKFERVSNHGYSLNPGHGILASKTSIDVTCCFPALGEDKSKLLSTYGKRIRVFVLGTFPFPASLIKDKPFLTLNASLLDKLQDYFCWERVFYSLAQGSGIHSNKKYPISKGAVFKPMFGNLPSIQEECEDIVD